MTTCGQSRKSIYVSSCRFFPFKCFKMHRNVKKSYLHCSYLNLTLLLCNWCCLLLHMGKYDAAGLMWSPFVCLWVKTKIAHWLLLQNSQYILEPNLLVQWEDTMTRIDMSTRLKCYKTCTFCIQQSICLTGIC